MLLCPYQKVRSLLTVSWFCQILTPALGISPAVAAVATDAVTTAYHGITRRAKVKKEETVFLFGLGGLGFNALQVVRAIGARVVVSDLRPEKLDAAFELGVPREDIVPAGKSVQDFVTEKGLEGKIDTVLEFVGKHQTFQDAQQIGEHSARQRRNLDFIFILTIHQSAQEAKFSASVLWIARMSWI